MKTVVCGVIFLTLSICAVVKADQRTFYPSAWVTIDKASRGTSSGLLQCRKNVTSEKQAIFIMDIFGTGPTQVPPGSTILSAELRLTATSSGGGDAELYRAADPWNSTSTWNSVGDMGTDGVSIGYGVSNGTAVTHSVKDHLDLWSAGTKFPNGWVLKGVVADSSDTEYVNGTLNDAPRLVVTYTPPDTTPPTITNVEIRRGPVTYTVPVGSGNQIKTIPLVSVSSVALTFTESVSVTASDFKIASAITGTPYSIAGVSSTGNTRTIIVSPTIAAKDKIVVTAYATIQDAAGNSLDGEWVNPSRVSSTGTDTFSTIGNGTAGGDFNFRFTLLPGDFNQDNVVDGNDFLIWQTYNGTSSGATFQQGDANGDGAVNATDLSIWSANSGTDYTTW